MFSKKQSVGLAAAVVVAGLGTNEAWANVACITNTTTGSCSCTADEATCTATGGTASTNPDHIRACCAALAPADVVDGAMSFPEPVFQQCGAAVALPASAVVTVQPDGGLLVTDPTHVDARGLARPRVKYTCTCDGGSGGCYPYWDGSSASCSSMTCSSCTLHREVISGERVAPSPGVVEGSGTVVFDSQRMCRDWSAGDAGQVALKQAQILLAMDRNKIPTPFFFGDEAIAPEGYEIYVDRSTAAPIVFVGPVNHGQPVQPGQRINRRAKCGCEASGGCHWEGLGCVPNGWPTTCTGLCSITVTEAR